MALGFQKPQASVRASRQAQAEVVRLRAENAHLRDQLRIVDGVFESEIEAEAHSNPAQGRIVKALADAQRRIHREQRET